VDYQKQWEFLKKSAELERLSHAYLFSGSERSGKKEVALQLCQLLNCERQLEARPCLECRVCLEIQENRHPDLTFIEPNPDSAASEKLRKEIPIGKIRQLAVYFSLAPYAAPFKIAIIDQAHAMNQEAQSAFLKLLEEPKGNALFLLLTQHPRMLLETIRSRAQEIKFFDPKPLSVHQTPLCESAAKDLARLQAADFGERFEYAKNLADSPQQAAETLECWLLTLREQLLEESQHGTPYDSFSLSKLKKNLEIIQEISFLTSTTNVNLRLALERIMLEL